MTVLRVAISALAAKSYGGDSYFNSLLPGLALHAPSIEPILLVRDSRYDELCAKAGIRSVVRLPAPDGPARILWEQTRLPAVLREIRADVLYTATGTGPLRSPCPVVIAVRNMEPFVPIDRRTSSRMRLRLRLLRWMIERSARSARRVVAVSRFVRSALLECGVPSERIDVIYHAVDDIPEPAGNETAGFVAAAAKFVRYANLETLVSAYAFMRERGYRGDLQLAGGPHDDAYESEIRELVRRLGVEPFVRFLGYRPRAEVHELMRRSDVFLFPSTLEACPFTLLEAKRMGAAVVSSSAPPMPEFGADGLEYAPPRDPEVFASKAMCLVSDPKASASLRARARARARGFSWETAIRQLTATWEAAACAS